MQWRMADVVFKLVVVGGILPYRVGNNMFKLKIDPSLVVISFCCKSLSVMVKT